MNLLVWMFVLLMIASTTCKNPSLILQSLDDCFAVHVRIIHTLQYPASSYEHF